MAIYLLSLAVLMMRTITDVASEDTEIQKEVERTVLPLMVDSRWRRSFGVT